MTIYYLLYIFIACSACLFTNNSDSIRYREKQAIFAFGMIILVLGLRHPSMGCDLQYGSSYGYLWSFEQISSLSFSQIFSSNGWLNYEWGYILFNKIISFVSTDYLCLLLMAALCSIVPIGYLINKYSPSITFSTFIYLGLPCFLISFSGLRQGMAVGICAFAASFIPEKKWKQFILVTFIAILFHYTAILFFIAYPVFNLRFMKERRWISVIIIPVIYIFKSPLFLILSKIVKENATVDDNGSFTLFAVFTLVYVFAILFEDQEDTIAAGYLNLFWLACICQCFGAVSLMAMRIGYYFMPAIAIVLPRIVYNERNTSNYKVLHGIMGNLI